jgi:hypothetical protein
MLGMAVVGGRKTRYINRLYRYVIYRQVISYYAGDVDNLLVINRGKRFLILQGY